MEQARALLTALSDQAAALFDRLVRPLRDAVSKTPFETTLGATAALYTSFVGLASVALSVQFDYNSGDWFLRLGELAVYFSTISHFTLTGAGFLLLSNYNPYPILPTVFLFLDLAQATALGAVVGASPSSGDSEWRDAVLAYGCWVVILANLACMYKSYILWSDLRMGKRNTKTGELMDV